MLQILVAGFATLSEVSDYHWVVPTILASYRGHSRAVVSSVIVLTERSAEPDERGGVEEASQQPSGPGNRQGSGEWPDPDTRPADVVDYEPQRVPVNMYETEGAVVLVLPMPGVMADDLSLDIEDDRLHVNATERTATEKVGHSRRTGADRNVKVVVQPSQAGA